MDSAEAVWGSNDPHREPTASASGMIRRYGDCRSSRGGVSYRGVTNCGAARRGGLPDAGETPILQRGNLAFLRRFIENEKYAFQRGEGGSPHYALKTTQNGDGPRYAVEPEGGAVLSDPAIKPELASDEKSLKLPASPSSNSPQSNAAPVAAGSSAETDASAVGRLTSRIIPAGGAKGGPEVKAEAPAKPTGLLPQMIGRFRVQKLLGRGGMGSVYLAHDDQLDRPVALKVPSPPADPYAAERMVARFLREARSAATLSHPNICPIFDIGRDGDTYFIAMAYVNGQPLSSYIEAGEKQPPRQVAMVIRKAALALEDAHKKGIIHRDLKPANIMIDQRGEPVVMDFGLASRLDHDLEARLTQDGRVVGTPTYMSPEQIDSRCEVGPASDVYSLGVVMYELLGCVCPFTGSVVSVIGKVLNVEPKPIRQLRPDVPEELAKICHRAMAKNRKDRFASMKEFADALTEFLKGKPQAPRQPSAKPVTKLEPAPLADLQSIDALLGEPIAGGVNLAATSLRKKQSQSLLASPWVWIAVAVAVILAAGAIVFLSLGTSDDSASKPAAAVTPSSVAPTNTVGRGVAAAPTADSSDKGAPAADSSATATPSSTNEPTLTLPKNFPIVGAAPPNQAGQPSGPDSRFDMSPYAQIDSIQALDDFFEKADENHDGKLDRNEMPLLIIIRAATKKNPDTVTLKDMEKAFKKLGKKLFQPPTKRELQRIHNLERSNHPTPPGS